MKQRYNIFSKCHMPALKPIIIYSIKILEEGFVNPCFVHKFSLKAPLYYMSVKDIRKQQSHVEK